MWFGFDDFSITRMTDGYRVTGCGRCILCDSQEEAESIIADFAGCEQHGWGQCSFLQRGIITLPVN